VTHHELFGLLVVVRSYLLPKFLTIVTIGGYFARTCASGSGVVVAGSLLLLE